MKKFLSGRLYFLLLTLAFFSCKEKATFQKISSSHTGIHFNNIIKENDSVNVLDLSNVYNGGGVGIGDFNNDGLQDIYFTGNLVSNKLYLNKGSFAFKDVTQESDVDGEGRWCRGVSIVDINNDGWLDIYVSCSMQKKGFNRQNLLYINQGADKNGVPHFKEMAAEYALNDTTHTTMAEFFDYDNDGDLDVYFTVNEIPQGDYPNRYRKAIIDGSFPSTGRLCRNDYNAGLRHPVFTNISKEAGITIEGFGHNACIADFNLDGWKDIYVTNDYLSANILYINNHDGTFTDRAKDYFKHTSANSMGSDVADFNNDGLQDVFELDMDPEDNYRKKMMLNPNSYQTYRNNDFFGYQYQYVRNTLQLNQGKSLTYNDSVSNPVFSDISFMSGLAETDWSWAPLIADFDNDGFKDVIVTNGFPKDVTDHDFIAFRDKSFYVASKKQLLDQIPVIKIDNYAFRNNGNLTFTNVAKQWGLNTPSFSNGAAYADLDNDGDLDFVVNNINDEAFVYKNLSTQNKTHNHYLEIKFSGNPPNINGLGTFVDVYYAHGKAHQIWENNPYRGYLSSVQGIAHFGVDTIDVIDSVVIRWPDGKKQVLQNIKADQSINVNIKNAALQWSFNLDEVNTNAVFKNITNSVNIHYVQKERDFIDFNIQKLLPHKFSEYGPGLAAGDIDGNGLDDLVIGGSFFYSGEMFLQQKNGNFIQKTLLPDKDSLSKNSEDEGLLLFDADGDGDQDLYIASGGYEFDHDLPNYQDKFYTNDGQGNFKADTSALPKNFTSKFCVRAVDYDKDGDLDLFVAGRVDPWNYPKPVSSLILRNDSKNGIIKFTDATAMVAKDLINIGLVCDAAFSDFNNDGWIDLILAGEWMPVTFLENEKGVFKNVTASSGIADQIGWWNTIAPGDFDNDGDIDYLVGNTGLNTFYRANDKYPVSIYAKDFNSDGSYDAVTSVYLPDNGKNGILKEFPAISRDEMIKQMITMRRRYENYFSYATATMDSVLPSDQRKDAIIYHANNLASCYLRNDGNGKFSLEKLPVQAQISVLCGIAVSDFDGDGNLDAVINGNDYGTEVGTGRYDALNGLMLKGDGKGGFISLSIMQSGIFIPGNGKSLVQLRSADQKCLLAASENRGPLRIFGLNKNTMCMPLNANDVSAVMLMNNGKKRKQEFYYGSSYLSQSSRFLNVDINVKSVRIFNMKGESRDINF